MARKNARIVCEMSSFCCGGGWILDFTHEQMVPLNVMSFIAIFAASIWMKCGAFALSHRQKKSLKVLCAHSTWAKHYKRHTRNSGVFLYLLQRWESFNMTACNLVWFSFEAERNEQRTHKMDVASIKQNTLHMHSKRDNEEANNKKTWISEMLQNNEQVECISVLEKVKTSC